MKKQLGFWLGFVAALLAVVAAFLSPAPFTPAIVLTVLTMPAALGAVALGAWRLGIFGAYWTLVAIIAFPTITPARLEASFVFAYPLGLLVGGALYLHYRNTSMARQGDT